MQLTLCINKPLLTSLHTYCKNSCKEMWVPFLSLLFSGTDYFLYLFTNTWKPAQLIGLMPHSKFALLEPGTHYTSSQEPQASRAPQPRRKAVERRAAHCRFRPGIAMLSVKSCCGSVVQVDGTAMFCVCSLWHAWKKKRSYILAHVVNLRTSSYEGLEKLEKKYISGYRSPRPEKGGRD